MEFSGKQTLSKGERYLPKKPSSCPPKCYELSVLMFLPPGCFWKWNLLENLRALTMCVQLLLWGRSLLFAVQETEWCMQGIAHSTPPSLSTHADVLGDMGLGWICQIGLEFVLVPITLRYHISSIRRRDYYLFHCSFLCGYYLRVATIQGQHLFLWKARRHQRQLDKIHTSETVMVARRCQ